jgi:Flp pilus assembly pilin Flp
MLRTIRHFVRDDSGTTSIEYALVTGMMALTLVGAWPLLNGGFDNLWGAIVKLFDSVPK